MTNAKKELEQLLEGKAKIKCASITEGYQYGDEEPCPKFELKVNHTEEEFQSFLKSLNFNYDSGYGSQELFGTVWLEDGTWCTRGEYDGSEWWVHNQLPEIPSELLLFLCDICGQEKNGRKFPVLDENWNKQNGLNQCEDCFKKGCDIG